MSDQQKSPRTSLDAVIIFTSRMKELAGFYSQSLGIGPYQESPKHLGCVVGSVYVGFDQVDAEPDKSRNEFEPTIWFTVEDIDDLDGNIFGISQRLVNTVE